MGRRRVVRRTRNVAPDTRAILGVAWYRPEQWQHFLALAADRHKLHDTYEEWLREAEHGMRGLRRQGFIVRRVDVDVDEMVRWCEANQLPFDGGARAQFVAKKVHDPAES